jgi:hypothetical protein
MARQTAAKAGYDASKVTLDITRLRARDMSIISRGSKSWDEWAGILAHVVVSAPGLEGNVSDREVWLDLLKGDFEKTVQAVLEELQGKN